MISAARSGLGCQVTTNLALTRQAKILLPLRGSRMARPQASGWSLALLGLDRLPIDILYKRVYILLTECLYEEAHGGKED
jgi:hypothetical protein